MKHIKRTTDGSGGSVPLNGLSGESHIPPPRVLSHPNGDLARDDRRIEWIVLGIAQHQLKRMLARRQFDTGFGLARAEMKMVLVLRDRLVRFERFIPINQ